MSNGKKTLRKLLKNKLAVLGMVILVILVIMAVFAPQISGTDDPNEMDYANIFVKPLSLIHISEPTRP